MRSIYFDYNATTPLDPNIREAMQPFQTEIWGNPSSVHHVGRRARAALDQARERAARTLACKPSEVIFTSGGTESVNLGILGTARHLKYKGNHIVTSAIEHHAVLHACEYLTAREGFEVTYLPVTREGLVTLDSVKGALRPSTILVSIMAANNEIGTVQPVSDIGALCRERQVCFHTDAVQWFGKQRFETIHELNADLVSFCAHKIHGPKGAGLLFARSPLHPDPILFGGGHENERRAGTENLAAIMGLVKALELFVPQPVFAAQQLAPLVEKLRRTLEEIQGAQIIGSRTSGLANTLSFVVEGTDSSALLAGLDLEGICASSGSACSAGSLEGSHVVLALGLGQKLANALVRFSLGRDSTMEEVEIVAGVLPKIIQRAQLGN
jgi:cysteine desulfurase